MNTEQIVIIVKGICWCLFSFSCFVLFFLFFSFLFILSSGHKVILATTMECYPLMRCYNIWCTWSCSSSAQICSYWKYLVDFNSVSKHLMVVHHKTTIWVAKFTHIWFRELESVRHFVWNVLIPEGCHDPGSCIKNRLRSSAHF